MDTKTNLVFFSWEIFLIRSSICFLDFGTKPKKANSDIVNPDNCKLDIIEEGPGTDVTLILFAIQYCTKLYPGSEISGDPASDIRTQFLFFNKTLIWSITVSYTNMTLPTSPSVYIFLDAFVVTIQKQPQYK